MTAIIGCSVCPGVFFQVRSSDRSNVVKRIQTSISQLQDSDSEINQLDLDRCNARKNSFERLYLPMFYLWLVDFQEMAQNISENHEARWKNSMNQKSLSSNTWKQVNCFLMFVFNRHKCCEPSNELHRGTTQWTVYVSSINMFFPSPIPDSQLILLGFSSSRRRFSLESLILSTVREKNKKRKSSLANSNSTM